MLPKESSGSISPRFTARSAGTNAWRPPPLIQRNSTSTLLPPKNPSVIDKIHVNASSLSLSYKRRNRDHPRCFSLSPEPERNQFESSLLQTTHAPFLNKTGDTGSLSITSPNFIPSSNLVASSEHLSSKVEVNHLELLAAHIGSKLATLTNHLGLHEDEYDNAIAQFKSPEYQALYVLKLWHNEEKKIGDLCDALDRSGLSNLAKW